MKKTNFLTVKQLKSKLLGISLIVGSSRDKYIVFNPADSDCTPCIEITEEGYHWLITERGNIIESKKTTDLKELLYWASLYYTFGVANDYELRWRYRKIFFRKIFRMKEQQYDCRREIFRKQLELLRKIDPDYEKWQREEILEILKRNPFTDELPNIL
jgi:hypothetical protein